MGMRVRSCFFQVLPAVSKPSIPVLQRDAIQSGLAYFCAGVQKFQQTESLGREILVSEDARIGNYGGLERIKWLGEG